MANTIQVKRGANASLPILSAAEFGFSTDTKQVYIGDGVDNHELAKVAWVSDNFNNYSHPNHTGDVTSSGDGAQSIADNAVTLAKMAHGTDGNLITYDANGAPAYVSTGTANQVLTSNGAGAAPTFQNSTGATSVLTKFSLEASDGFTIPDKYQYIVHGLEIGDEEILIENGGELVLL